jgi:hypothetical protein
MIESTNCGHHSSIPQVDPPLEIQEHQRETGCGSADGMEDHHVLSFLVSKTAETITLF